MLRHAAVIVLALMLAVPIAGAQPLKVASAGDKALLFNFSGLGTLNLGEYQGGVGGKYFLSDGMAVRGMLLLGVNNITNKGSAGFTDATDNTFSFGLGGGLEYHLPLASSVSPYLGGAISFTTSSEKYTPSVFTGGTATTSKTSATSFGIGAIGGVEYFFNQNISLSAEYQFGLSVVSKTNPDVSQMMLGFQTAGLTFAVYF
jgi:opacity protein-like surface antigen